MKEIAISLTNKDLKRFSARIYKTSNCWFWIGNCNSEGYGQLDMKTGRSYKAHRVAWFLEHGTISSGLKVLHQCDTPQCVRPDHLFLGKDADNRKDAISKGILCGGKIGLMAKRCKNGHLFNDENTYQRKDGLRNCRTCGRINARKYFRRKSNVFKLF